MAYDLSQRFSSEPTYYRILDPGAYQKISSQKTQINKVPFLSNTPRRTQPGRPIWTHAMYNTDISANILNCTGFKSKLPRFPYEALTDEDIKELLCQCGIQSPCECPTSEHEDEIVLCQGKVRRRIFKGPPPRVDSTHKNKIEVTDVQPPFYDTTVIESTAFYKGCKWSNWTSKRSASNVITGPGPADYIMQHEPREENICAEKIRAYRRKTSKQLRYIEAVQQRNIREGQPGPGSYSPQKLKGTDLSYLGPKAKRFSVYKYDIRPGPSDYWVKRDFEKPQLPEKLCKAQLVAPPAFGCKAIRLKPMFKKGPSPASYNPKSNICKIMHCSTAPFGSSTIRFRETVDGDDKGDDKGDDNADDEKFADQRKPVVQNSCLLPTWEFRSQTVRMKKLLKKLDEPSPADLPQRNIKILRSLQLQSAAPFFSSDDRFRPWYNWISVHGAQNTPGPCYYSLEKPICQPAVHRGPLVRSLRFEKENVHTPGPNQYNVGGGIENILATHNQRLKSKMENMHKFCWKPKNKISTLSFEEREEILLNRSIELLNGHEM